MDIPTVPGALLASEGSGPDLSTIEPFFLQLSSHSGTISCPGEGPVDLIAYRRDYSRTLLPGGGRAPGGRGPGNGPEFRFLYLVYVRSSFPCVSLRREPGGVGATQRGGFGYRLVRGGGQAPICVNFNHEDSRG